MELLRVFFLSEMITLFDKHVDRIKNRRVFALSVPRAQKKMYLLLHKLLYEKKLIVLGSI